ncbi:HD domain-containing protein [Aliiruegeria sabulilitoris]|uniref:HD domain-containing protein n=1 Tax=Aliiruegeria sabulilitoris TaxID=1510458 RepID=UPI000832A66B|nr:HD domain-containing protein [Aliiruegeria sabulilitoris]NDR59308.1 HD domain-containing protein [Pseudoruegeria sp. M32A2M]
MTDLVLAARSFAETRHAGQVRKDAEGSPYFIHLEEVSALTERFGGDEIAICAAWLHDTVEDCPPTSAEEIAETFGAEVASVVAELTDDKSLLKAERKRLQVVNAAKKSARACLVKLADKSSNCRSVIETPPADWNDARRLDYVEWSARVVSDLAHCPPEALAHFEALVIRARREIRP